jgi:hypothetical protein
MTARPDLALLHKHVPSWTTDQVQALDPWRQGDVLLCPPLGWSTTAEPEDPVTGMPTPAGGLVPWDGDLPKYAIVTSQTCDIGGKPPGDRQPFVQVSPVVNVGDIEAEKWQELRSWKLVDRVALTSKSLRAKWVADLRVSFPVSKAVLVSVSPTRGFATEHEALKFGEHLARRAARPALHDFLTETVRSEIDAAIKASHKVNTGWWSKVDEVRLLLKGDRLVPEKATIVVLTTTQLSPDEEDRWVTLSATFEKRAKVHGMRMTAPLVQRVTEMHAATYRDTVGMYLSNLKR